MRSFAIKTFFTLWLLVLTTSPVQALAASLSVSPASGTFEVGERITVKVVVSSPTPINAIASVLSIPSDLFSIDSVSKSGSILNFWVTEPSISRSPGSVQSEGVTLGGFNAGGGTVVTTVIRPLKEGTAKISFKSGQVLANDGEGTDVTGTLTGATYTIVPATVKPSTPKPTVVPVPEPEPVEVEIIKPQISWMILLTFIILILIIIILIIIDLYEYYKNKRMRAYVMKESKDAEEALHDTMERSRSDAADAVSLKKDLDEAEKRVGKEIKDIESL